MVPDDTGLARSRRGSSTTWHRRPRGLDPQLGITVQELSVTGGGVASRDPSAERALGARFGSALHQERPTAEMPCSALIQTLELRTLGSRIRSGQLGTPKRRRHPLPAR